MAIIEFQFRKQAFLDYFKAEINRRRLPFPKLDSPLFPELKDRLLEQIECVSCSAAPTGGAGQLTLQLQLAIHYHKSFDTIRAAGSLQRPVTEQKATTLQVQIGVNLVPRPGKTALPQLQWSATGGLYPPQVIPMDLPEDINIQSGAVEASNDIVTIRLGTQPDDPVNGPVTSRLGNGEWSQLIPGRLMADQLADSFSKTLESALSDDFEQSEAVSSDWIPPEFALIGWKTPLVMASAEVTAVDQCILDIDVSVDLSLIAEFEVSGHSLVTTLTLNWDADSTLCDVVGTLLLTPIGGIAIHIIAEDKASEVILGIPATPDRFHKIGSTEHSITYRSEGFLATLSSSFVLTHSELNSEGLLLTGTIHSRPLPRGLEGEATAPISGLHVDCGKRSVSVKSQPAQVYLRDMGMDGGPPALFPGGVLFNPAGAWVTTLGVSNTWLDLLLTFADPPGGRLPVGTATSVILDTDCGVRWVDLGVIPPDHAPPTQGDVLRMISQCMTISDPWGMGVMNLHWIPDPPGLKHEFDPLRQWSIGARELPERVRLQFVAVDATGAERIVGTISGRQNVATQITTNANETLQIRTGHRISAPAPVVFQRWIVPFASVPLHSVPSAVSSFGGMIGLRGEDGETHVVQIGSDGAASTHRLSQKGPPDPAARRLLANLAREVKRNRKPWAGSVRLDRNTVAVAHGKQLLIGKAGPMTRL